MSDEERKMVYVIATAPPDRVLTEARTLGVAPDLSKPWGDQLAQIVRETHRKGLLECLHDLLVERAIQSLVSYVETNSDAAMVSQSGPIDIQPYLDAGWTWDGRTDYVEGKRVRILNLPEGEKAGLIDDE